MGELWSFHGKTDPVDRFLQMQFAPQGVFPAWKYMGAWRHLVNVQVHWQFLSFHASFLVVRRFLRERFFTSANCSWYEWSTTGLAEWLPLEVRKGLASKDASNSDFVEKCVAYIRCLLSVNSNLLWVCCTELFAIFLLEIVDLPKEIEGQGLGQFLSIVRE